MKIEFTPIGTIHSPHLRPEGTPIQPRFAGGAEGTVELFAQYLAGLRDLAGFERIWLLYWFDRTYPAQLEVVPFRDSKPHGVFATRAPSRPNPLGLSCVRLLSVEGCRLRVAELDVLDATPLLDIKPYLPDCDAFEVARTGWWAHAGGTTAADARFSRK